MSGYVQSFRSVSGIEVGDPSNTTELQLGQGFGAASMKKARVVWVCLTESID